MPLEDGDRFIISFAAFDGERGRLGVRGKLVPPAWVR